MKLVIFGALASSDLRFLVLALGPVLLAPGLLPAPGGRPRPPWLGPGVAAEAFAPPAALCCPRCLFLGLGLPRYS